MYNELYEQKTLTSNLAKSYLSQTWTTVSKYIYIWVLNSQLYPRGELVLRGKRVSFAVFEKLQNTIRKMMCVYACMYTFGHFMSKSVWKMSILGGAAILLLRSKVVYLTALNFSPWEASICSLFPLIKAQKWTMQSASNMSECYSF